MIELGHAAKRIGVETIVGFSGSPHWHMIAGFPPVVADDINAGFRQFVSCWSPVIDEYERLGVRFALEVHPGQVAFDYWTTKRTLDEMKSPTRLWHQFRPRSSLLAVY